MTPPLIFQVTAGDQIQTVSADPRDLFFQIFTCRFAVVIFDKNSGSPGIFIWELAVKVANWR